jgi:hypothetical protein
MGLVTKDESDLVALLRRLDDPEWLERPSDYSNSKAAASLKRLVSGLESAFGAHCPAEGNSFQDGSEYGRVEIPATATVYGTRIIVCLSKFAPLALVAADNPGAYLGLDDAQALGDLDSRDRATVCQRPDACRRWWPGKSPRFRVGWVSGWCGFGLGACGRIRRR